MNTSMQKIKDTDTLLSEMLIIKESCNLTITFETNFSQTWGLHRKTENCNVFHFKLLLAKSNDKIL